MNWPINSIGGPYQNYYMMMILRRLNITICSIGVYRVLTYILACSLLTIITLAGEHIFSSIGSILVSIIKILASLEKVNTL